MNRILIRSGQDYGWVISSLIVFIIAAGGMQNGAPPFISIIGILCGNILLGLRRYYIVDIQKKSIACSWRFLRVVPLLSFRRRPISDFSAVHIRVQYESDGDGDSVKLHLVKLKGSSPLVVAKYTKYLASRKLAEKLSRAMQLPLSDRISGATSIRKPEEISLTLRERLLRSGNTPGLPQPPPNDILQASINDGVATLILAPQPTATFVIVGSQILCGGFIIGGFFIGGFGGLVFGGIGLYTALIFLRGGIASQFPLVVRVSGSAIETRQTMLFRKRIENNSLSEIVFGPQGLFLLGDTTYIVMPYSFSSKKEKEIGIYIRDLMCHVIGSGHV